MAINIKNIWCRYRSTSLLQQGSASIEYAIVTGLVVVALVIGASGDETLSKLALAVVNFYADFSYAISLATP